MLPTDLLRARPNRGRLVVSYIKPDSKVWLEHAELLVETFEDHVGRSAGELRDAIAQYRGALERCPTFHDIRHRLAITLREAGLPAQAAQELQRILRLHPGLLDSQIQLGLTWYSMGRTPDAVRNILYRGLATISLAITGED